MSLGHVMKVSRNGQVSIPAEARARWRTQRVLVVDLGDRIVMRPLPDDPVRSLIGKYPGGPPSTESRRRARQEDAAAERRRTRGR